MPHRFTVAQYVALTRNVRDVKLEFFDGTVWAMAGGSPRHSFLAMETGALLREALRGGPCKVFNADLGVGTQDGLYTYPDASVVCGTLTVAPGTDHATNPIVVVEVLSRSTRDYDEGEKLDRYQTIATLRHILHVDQDALCVVHYARDANGSWSSVRCAAQDDVIALSGIGAKLRVGDIYQGAFDLPA